MGKIICIIGKSSTGKDTIYNRVMQDVPELRKYITYTTRPMRTGEADGREYYFVSEEDFQRLKQQGRVIEDRAYNTMEGLWRYFTVDDSIDLQKNDYCIIGTLVMYNSLKSFYGGRDIVPILISVDDGERLSRAVERERRQSNPKYKELCRRFLADEEDFADEKILEAGITVSFENKDVEECTREIEQYIRNRLAEC